MTGDRWNPHTDPVLRCLTAAHARIAAYAREQFKAYGRGVVRIEFAGTLSNDATTQTPMEYHDLRSVRASTAGTTGRVREDADALIRLLETYQPDEQAVVMATAAGRLPVMVRIRLDVPTIVGQPQRPQ